MLGMEQAASAESPYVQHRHGGWHGKSGRSAQSYQAGIRNLKEQAVTLMTESCCLPFSSRSYPVYSENVYFGKVYSGDKTVS